MDSDNEIKTKFQEARQSHLRACRYLTKKRRGAIGKRLYEIENTQNIDTKLKNTLIKELDSIIVSLNLDLKRMKNEYRDDKYANIDDIVRMCSILYLI